MSFRAAVVTECGANDETVAEILAYSESPYRDGGDTPATLPLEDEAHVEAWTDYEQEAAELGAFEALKRRLVQLSFPIREGISAEQPYRRATRKGDFAAAGDDSPGLELADPDAIELTVCPTIAGRIPVIVASHRDDFVALVRACTGRNEPILVPDSMGACFIAGFNNWDRIATYRRGWEANRSSPPSEAEWNEEFRRLVPRKHLYQDRFIILSRGPYSAVRHSEVDLDEADWLEQSLAIRREHEFTHYFTYRVFGLIRSNALDELIADFNGLVRAVGTYDADRALRFLGLESFPQFRDGGRLGDYRGDPPLSEPAFEVLQTLAHRSVENLAKLSQQRGDLLADLEGLAAMTYALARLTLEELASAEMLDRFDMKLT